MGELSAADGNAGGVRAVVKTLLNPPDILLTLAIYAYCVWKHPAGWTYVACLILAAIGFAGWIVARVQLGRNFTLRAEARGLVTAGVYSRIRNPIYLFSTVGLLFMILAMRWYRAGLAYTTLVTVIQWQRARKEARVLEAEFGDQYRAYRAHTWL